MIVIVLLLKTLKPHTGNNSTIKRIESYFGRPRYKCLIVGANTYKTTDNFHQFLQQQHVNIVIGIHAYHAGRLLVNSPVPYIMIFGGTDLNEYSDHVDKLEIMTNVVENAKKLVIFSGALEKKAQVIWTDLRNEDFIHIPQAVITLPSKFKIINYLQRHNFLPYNFINDHSKPTVLTLIAGIRPVKDPLFLTSTLSKWHRSHPETFLLIIGPIMDEFYAKNFSAKIKQLPGIIFIPGLPHSDIHAIIKDSFAVINSSISEGMSSALLEAMDLETLVIVRDNPGNCSLVNHGENGLVFSTPTEFISCLNSAFYNPARMRLMVDNAKRMVTKKHCCEFERKQYRQIVDTYASLSGNRTF